MRRGERGHTKFPSSYLTDDLHIFAVTLSSQHAPGHNWNTGDSVVFIAVPLGQKERMTEKCVCELWVSLLKRHQTKPANEQHLNLRIWLKCEAIERFISICVLRESKPFCGNAKLYCLAILLFFCDLQSHAIKSIHLQESHNQHKHPSKCEVVCDYRLQVNSKHSGNERCLIKAALITSHAADFPQLPAIKLKASQSPADRI